MADFNYSMFQVQDMCTKELGWNGEVSPSGELVCYCPIHGDTNASLHVGLKDGKILIHCWSHGCDSQIYKYLSERRAWPQQLESKEAAEKENKRYEKLYPERAQPKYKWNSLVISHKAAVRKSEQLRQTITLREGGAGKPINYQLTLKHVYTDGEKAHSIVARYDAQGKTKRILQYSYGYYDEHDEPNRPTDPNNPAWQIKGWSNEEVQHMLYAVTYMLSSPEATVVVVEGEKAADYGNAYIRQRYPQFVFTTWKGGTQAVPRTDWSPLEGRNVVILPDADGVGVEAGIEVYEQLKTIASSAKIVDVLKKGLPKKWDIADYPKSTDVPKFLDLIDMDAEDCPPMDPEDPGPVPPEYGGDDSQDGDDEDDGLEVKIIQHVIFPYTEDNSHMDDMRSYFDKRWASLEEGGKNYVVVVENIKKKPGSALIPQKAFIEGNRHIKIQMEPKGPYVGAASVWLAGSRRSFDKTDIEPSKGHTYIDENGLVCANLWQGIAAENVNQDGSCEKFLNHIKFICSGEENSEELEHFILVFLARMIREPSKRSGAILLLRGEQGSGKSLFGEYVARMIGHNGVVSISSLSTITDRFNSSLYGKLLCRVEESKIPGGAQLEKLKDLATNPKFMSEGKGVDPVMRNNFIHFLFTGNYDYIASISKHERRLVPIDVPDDKIGNTEYFDALVEEMEGEGPGALYKFLMNYEMPKGNLPHPTTKALASQRQQTKSFGAEGRFLDWYAKSLRMGGLISGPTGPSFQPWKTGEEFNRAIFWDAFEAWQKENVTRNNMMLSKRFFYKFLENFCHGEGHRGATFNNPPKGRFAARYSAYQRLTFPDLTSAKDTFMEYVDNDDTYDVYTEQDLQTQSEL